MMTVLYETVFSGTSLSVVVWPIMFCAFMNTMAVSQGFVFTQDSSEPKEYKLLNRNINQDCKNSILILPDIVLAHSNVNNATISLKRERNVRSSMTSSKMDDEDCPCGNFCCHPADRGTRNAKLHDLKVNWCQSSEEIGCSCPAGSNIYNQSFKDVGLALRNIADNFYKNKMGDRKLCPVNFYFSLRFQSETLIATSVLFLGLQFLMKS